MSKDTTTQSANTESTSQRQSWQECEHHFDNLQSCVLVDVDDTLDSIFSSDMAIGRYVAQRAGIGINAGASVESTLRSEAEKYSTRVLFLSLKSLNQLYDVALKMGFVADQQQSTSQSGTKKSKTS